MRKPTQGNVFLRRDNQLRDRKNQEGNGSAERRRERVGDGPKPRVNRLKNGKAQCASFLAEEQ